jgi:ABC-type uncharacterized transport system
MNQKINMENNKKILFLTLLKRELKLQFTSPFIYILSAAYLIIGGLLAFNYLFATGIVSLKPYFQIAPLLIILFSIILSSGLLLNKKENMDITSLLPCSEGDIVTAGYLSGIIMILILLLSGYIIPLTIIIFNWGKLDMGAVFSGNLGLFLTGSAFVAIGMGISSFNKNQTVTLIISMFIAFLLWIPTHLGSVLPSTLNSFLLNLSFNYNLDYFTKGLFVLNNFFYFISLTILGFSLALLGLKKRRWGKLPLFLYSYLVIPILIILFLSLFSMKFNKKVDLTSDKIFTLDSSTKKIVKSLNEDVTLYFFCSNNIPLKLETIKDEIISLLNQYKNLSSNIKIKIIDPDKSEDYKRVAASYGVQKIEIGKKGGNSESLHRIYFALVLVKGEVVESIPEVVNTKTLEYSLTYRFKRLIEPPRTLIFTNGHGEFPAKGEKSIRGGFGELFNNLKGFETKVVNIKTKEIPKNADLLIVAGPIETLDKNSVNKIRKFFMGGKPVLILGDGLKDKYEQLNPGMPRQWRVNESGLNQLLDEFGVSLNTDVVLSFKAPKISVGKIRVETYPLMPIIKVTKTFSILPFSVSSLKITKSKNTGFEVVDIIKSPSAWIHKNVFIEDRKWPQTKEKGKFPVGALIRGTKNGKYKNAKMFVFADSDIFRDLSIKTINTHLIFFRHLINQLLGDDLLKKLRFKGRGVSYLKVKNSVVTKIIRGGAVIIPPLFLIILGLIYNVIRRKKGKRTPKRIK